MNSFQQFSIICVLVFLSRTYSQEYNTLNQDSLSKLDIGILLDNFDDNIGSNQKTAKIYAEVILAKLKESKSVTKIASGYRLMVDLYLNDSDIQIKYLDSAISFGEKSNYRYYPTKFYLNKGAICADKGLFSEAIDSYLKGLEFAKKKNDQENEFALNHNIALLKRKLGKYEEAISLFKKCLKFEELKEKKTKRDSLSYLVTLTDLVTTYLRNKEIDSALIYNANGIIISKNSQIRDLFELNHGIIEYHQKKYKNSISSIDKVLKNLSKNKNEHFSRYNIIDANYYLGKSFEALDRNERAIFYFKKIDSLVLETNYLIPEIRPAYNAIIQYYKSKGDKNNQLYYINRLLYNDSILDRNFRYINNKIIKDFDTPILIAEKEKLITDLETRNNRSNFSLIISIIGGIIVSIFLIFNYRKQRKYRIRFEELMKTVKEKPKSSINIEEKNNVTSSINISEEVLNKILLGLENFEKTSGFTRVNLTSSTLAKELKTNPKYLTKVIKHYKKKNFSPYVNDLRIEHIINRLKSNQKLQNYTIKAIATEAGFNSAEVFSKCFYQKTGIYPSYFVKKIQSSGF